MVAPDPALLSMVQNATKSFSSFPVIQQHFFINTTLALPSIAQNSERTIAVDPLSSLLYILRLVFQPILNHTFRRFTEGVPQRILAMSLPVSFTPSWPNNWPARYTISPNYSLHPDWDVSWLHQRIFWRAHEIYVDIKLSPFWVETKWYIQARLWDLWNLLTGWKTLLVFLLAWGVWYRLYGQGSYDKCKEEGICKSEEDYAKVRHLHLNWKAQEQTEEMRRRAREALPVTEEVVRVVTEAASKSFDIQQSSEIQIPSPSSSGNDEGGLESPPSVRPPASRYASGPERNRSSEDLGPHGDPQDRAMKWCKRCVQWHNGETYARLESW